MAVSTDTETPTEVVPQDSKMEQSVDIPIPAEQREPRELRELPRLAGKVKQCTRIMAHSVTETSTSPDANCEMDTAIGACCALCALPMANALTLLVGHLEMLYGYCYQNTPMQLHGGYLSVCWLYVTYVSVIHFCMPPVSNRSSERASFRLRIGFIMCLIASALTIFGFFYKFNFTNEPVEPYFDLDQTLLIILGLSVNILNMVLLNAMKPDSGSGGQFAMPPFEINAYRHLKFCSLGAVISLFVYGLDLHYEVNIKRDTFLLSYYFWAIVYCVYKDLSKFVYNIKTGNFLMVYGGSKRMRVEEANSV